MSIVIRCSVLPVAGVGELVDSLDNLPSLASLFGVCSRKPGDASLAVVLIDEAAVSGFSLEFQFQFVVSEDKNQDLHLDICS